MAHAAPRVRAREERRGTPDVFSERTHRAAKVALSVVSGLIYGVWAATNQRNDEPVTGGNVLFGFVTALVFAVLLAAVLAFAPKLRSEAHALLWAAFAGVTTGFLISQSPMNDVRSAVLGAGVAVGVLLLLYYRFSAHKDVHGDLVE
ncbi:hypothetical protein ACPF8X_39175 [Streptomyces sp. G35A]